jgi:predicted nucleic acid-binding Zn ribbon protein
MPTNSKPKHSFETLGDVLNHVIRKHAGRKDTEMLRVWQLWDALFTDDITTHARPAAFKDHLLIVHVSNSAWLYQLRFYKNDMIQRLNDALGKELINEIKLKIGSLA